MSDSHFLISIKLLSFRKKGYLLLFSCQNHHSIYTQGEIPIDLILKSILNLHFAARGYK